MSISGNILAQWLERGNSKPEDLGFEPLVGQGEGQFFLSPRVKTLADLFVSDLLSYVRHAPNLVRMLKIPYPSVVD